MTSRDERLRQLFAGYFNQDRGVTGAQSWRDVLSDYVRQVPKTHVLVLVADLRSWLEEGEAEGSDSLPVANATRPVAAYEQAVSVVGLDGVVPTLSLDEHRAAARKLTSQAARRQSSPRRRGFATSLGTRPVIDAAPAGLRV